MIVMMAARQVFNPEDVREPRRATENYRHCEERSDEAILAEDCFVATLLVMTLLSWPFAVLAPPPD